jgi:hypothetical protein
MELIPVVAPPAVPGVACALPQALERAAVMVTAHTALHNLEKLPLNEH